MKLKHYWLIWVILLLTWFFVNAWFRFIEYDNFMIVVHSLALGGSLWMYLDSKYESSTWEV